MRVYAGPVGAVHLTLDGPFPGSRFGWALVTAVATRTFTVELLVPDEPAFAGLTLAAQAFSLNKGLHATHGLHFTLGY